MAPYLLPKANSSDLLLHALETTEIAFLIRQELRGIDLKNCVLVCKAWWRLLAPFLWENIYIDYDIRKHQPGYSDADNTIVFRNGLAATSLTLSIYSPSDIDGSIAYIAQRCKNVDRLHLKLFSPYLTTTMDPTCKAEQPNPSSERNASPKSDKDTPVLDMLLSNLSNVSDLTLSFANPELAPQVIWCATQVSNRLRSLSLYGGLKCPGYIVHKNFHCDWDLITDVVRELPRLDTLSVHWKNTGSIPGGSWRNRVGTRTEPVLTAPSSLRNLVISDIYFEDATLLDALYEICPNIRSLRLSSAKASASVNIDSSIRRLLLSCKNFSKLQYYGNPSSNLSSAIFQESSHMWTPLSELAFSAADLKVSELELLGNSAPFSLSKLDVKDIESVDQFAAVLKSFRTLSSLRLSGRLGEILSSYRVHNAEAYFYRICEIPLFASGATLQRLDISDLLIQSFVLHERLFDKIQQLPQLMYLAIDFDHLVKADLELTWPYLCDSEEMKHGNSLPMWYNMNRPPSDSSPKRFPYPFWTQPHTTLASKKRYRERCIHNRLQLLRQGNIDLDSDDRHLSEDDSENDLEEEPNSSSSRPPRQAAYVLNVQPLNGGTGAGTYATDASYPYSYHPSPSSAKAQAEKTNFFERKFRLFSHLSTLYVHDSEPAPSRKFVAMGHFLSLHMVHGIVGMAPKLERLSYHQNLKLDLSRARTAYQHIDFYPVRP